MRVKLHLSSFIACPLAVLFGLSLGAARAETVLRDSPGLTSVDQELARVFPELDPDTRAFLGPDSCLRTRYELWKCNQAEKSAGAEKCENERLNTLIPRRLRLYCGSAGELSISELPAAIESERRKESEVPLCLDSPLRAQINLRRAQARFADQQCKEQRFTDSPYCRRLRQFIDHATRISLIPACSADPSARISDRTQSSGRLPPPVNPRNPLRHTGPEVNSAE